MSMCVCTSCASLPPTNNPTPPHTHKPATVPCHRRATAFEREYVAETELEAEGADGGAWWYWYIYMYVYVCVFFKYKEEGSLT